MNCQKFPCPGLFTITADIVISPDQLKYSCRRKHQYNEHDFDSYNSSQVF